MLLSNMNYRKEAEGKIISILFTYETRIALPAAVVLKEMEQALTDARQGWLWPHEFSVHTPDELPLREGVCFSTVYRMKNPQTGEVGEYNYRYQLSQWKPEQGLFEYRAQKGHPFPGGGAVVTITAVDADTCMFKWDGVYTHDGRRAAAEEIFSWYFSLFFGQLEKNIKARVEAVAAAQ